jgi:hypothetical protein
MDVLTFTRPSGPSETGSLATWMTLVTAQIPAGKYVFLATSHLRSKFGEFVGACRLHAYPAGGGALVDLGMSSFLFLNEATHHVQGSAALPTGATVRLMAQGSKNWYAERSSLIVIKADVLTATTVTK